MSLVDTRWVAIGDDYPDFYVRLWTNYPRNLLSDLNQTHDPTLQRSTLSQVVLAINDWADFDGAALPPVSQPAFWDAIPEELAEAIIALINREASTAGVLTEREQNMLRIWLRASSKAGLKVPWKYVRRQLAEKWQMAPWLIDISPMGEIELESQISNLEATVKPAGDTK